MNLRSWLAAVTFALVASSAVSCHKPPATSPPGPSREIDACTLLSRQEVEAVQKSPITDTKSSQRLDGDFRLAQCFYTAREFNKSINLALAQKHPTNTHSRTPRQFWRETFEQGGEKREEEQEEEEEEGERTPPKKIEGLGDDARWINNRFGGVLYVLKGDAFVSVSIGGGAEDEQAKIDRCRALAVKILERI